MDNEKNRPSLNFEDLVDGQTVSLAFGYMDVEDSQVPSMAVFRGDELLVILPRGVLATALEQGWTMERPACECDEVCLASLTGLECPHEEDDHV
jgi:hypothetical protein